MDATFNWKPEQTLLEKLITLAHQRGQSPESIVNEAVKLYLETESPKSNVTSDSDPLVGLFATANDRSRCNACGGNIGRLWRYPD